MSSVELIKEVSGERESLIDSTNYFNNAILLARRNMWTISGEALAALKYRVKFFGNNVFSISELNKDISQ